jgi:hypothetical protein
VLVSAITAANPIALSFIGLFSDHFKPMKNGSTWPDVPDSTSRSRQKWRVEMDLRVNREPSSRSTIRGNSRSTIRGNLLSTISRSQLSEKRHETDDHRTRLRLCLLWHVRTCTRAS